MAIFTVLRYYCVLYCTHGRHGVLIKFSVASERNWPKTYSSDGKKVLVWFKGQTVNVLLFLRMNTLTYNNLAVSFLLTLECSIKIFRPSYQTLEQQIAKTRLSE